MAWKTKPSFAIVATQEKSLQPVPPRRMYKRSGTIATEVDANDAVYISRPAAFAAIVERAAKAAQ